MLRTVLKIGKDYVDSVLRIIPYWQRHFRSHVTDITELLKEVQVITRQLQTLCAHGKVKCCLF